MLSESDLQAIRAVEQRWLAAEIAGDPAAVLEVCADDVVWMPPGEEALQGKAAIRAWLGQPADRIDDLRLTNVRIEGDGDIAYKTAGYRTRYVPGGSTQPVTATGSHVWVLRRVDGSWRVVLVAWTFLSNDSL
jgi:uncharacterized protein (TIGR02246 family)